MRTHNRLGTLIAIALLAAPLAHAGPLHDAQRNFSLTIPEGFVRAPEIESAKPDILYAYRRQADAGPGEIIIIQGMGGLLGRERMGAAGRLPGNADAIITMSWHGFNIDVAQVPEVAPGGIETLTYNAQVPLKPEAIQVSVVGLRASKERLVQLERDLLASLDGETNWLRSMAPPDPAGEQQYRMKMLISAIAFIVIGLVGFWFIALRKPGVVILITTSAYIASWFVNTGDLSEMHLAVGAVRMLSFFGMGVGLIGMYRLSRINRRETEAAGSETVTQGIAVDLRCSWFWQSLFYACRPIVEVDGVAHLARWGPIALPLPPGRHRVRIYFRYILNEECGVADTAIDVGEERVVRITYCAPYTAFQRGKLTTA